MREPRTPFEAPHLFSPQNQPTPADGIFFGLDGLRAGWGILLFFTLFLSLGLAMSFLVTHTATHQRSEGETHQSSRIAPSAEISARQLCVNEGLSLLAVLFTTFALARIEHRPFAVYGLPGPHRLPLFARGMLWGCVSLSLLVATLYLTGHLLIDARLLPTAQALHYGLIWAVGFTLVAFLEEMLLRGYLQYTLTRGLRAILPSLFDTPHTQAFAFWTAALILSFVFGLGHQSNPGESPIGLLSAGVAGLVFSLALYRSGSLWWALGFHTSWDWAQSFLYGVPDSGSVIQHRLLATHPQGAAILSGGRTGPEGSIFILPTLALVAIIILLTIPRKRTEAPAPTPQTS